MSGNIWDVIRAKGLEDYFISIWMDHSDEEEVARRLGAEAVSRSDFSAATKNYPFGSGDGPEETLWVGRHGPRWTHVLQISGNHAASPALHAGLTRDGGRLLFMCVTEVEGVEDLVLVENARRTDDIHAFNHTPARPDGLFARTMADLSFDGPPGTQENACLTVVGRITGTPLTEEWFDGRHLLCRVPLGVW
ncbi:hypothetical protein ACFQ08_10315 [Streptosporangium algeriense]|uniref:Uncharacterized protein n=1 Tax=Streptosporangium algeriense TaxID=1682748 RepID=A0ABW3DP47_9ACTN